MSMKQIRFSGIVIVFFMGIIFTNFSIRHDGSAAETTSANENIFEKILSESAQTEPFQIKLSVNEVRIDVVVLDKKGNQVTDLTAADFEVLHNKKRQNILSSVYIDNQSDAASKPPGSLKDSRNLPPLPTKELKREDTRRTIIFVVDDLSMSFENGYYAKMALRNFVEKQMRTGDIVAMLRTGYGNSALHMFISDKQQALARIDAMATKMALSRRLDDSDLYSVYDNQLSALSYSFRALKDMPGRKILIMMTAMPGISKPNNSSMVSRGGKVPIEKIDFYALYFERFNRLSDDAIRTGVVVNFLDIKGIKAYEAVGAVNRSITINPSYGSFELLGREDRGLQSILIAGTVFPTTGLDAPNPLPEKTGGVIIENSNFFLDGIGKETESLMKGYYLISYEPPSDTFNPKSDKDKEIFNKIKVNVKRRNVQVHTRDGFYNRLEGEMDAAQPVHPLQDAIFSPFLHADLDVNVIAGYVKDAKAGHLVRSWIHLDPKDVKIVETVDGGARIDLEIVCLTSDTNGFVQDVKFVEHALTIEPENKAENLAWVRKHGVRFAMLLPVKKPGSYYVRVAVRDKESGKTGSAYQFMEIPDPGKRGLALSNIFMLAGADDLKWLLSEAGEVITEGVFFPVFQAEEVRSPALRTYSSGDVLQIMTMLYNADEKAISDSEIEMDYVLYKDGAEYLRRGKPVSHGSAVNLDGIPLTMRLTMGTDIPPGDYVLQLIVTDKRNSGRREGYASQAISFTVAEK